MILEGSRRSSADWLAQSGDGMSRSEPNSELVVMSATDDGGVVGIFPNPDHALWVHKDFHAIYVFEHDKLHVALLKESMVALQGETSARCRTIVPKHAAGR